MAPTSTERYYSRRNAIALVACCLLVLAATVVIVLALVLTRDDNGPKGRWVETFGGTYSSRPEDIGKGGMPVHQLYLTRNDGSRLFASKQQIPYETTLLHIFDFNQTSEKWMLQSELQVGTDLERENITYQKGIYYMAPSLDGTRVAIADAENVTVYREEKEDADGNSTWVQVGEKLSTQSLAGHVNTIPIGWQAVLSLSRDGKLLTVASRVNYQLYNGSSLDDDEGPYLISNFQEVNNNWTLLDVQPKRNVFGSLTERGAHPVISGSGDTVAFPRFIQEDDEWKEGVEVYGYSPASNNWTLASRLIEPPPVADNQPPMTMFGSDARSIDFSYNGQTCAIGAINFKASNDFHYGRVEVYEQDDDGGGEYVLKGQALVPPSDAWQYGKLVSLSEDGDRLAVCFGREGFLIQVFEYDHDDAKWRSFDNYISERNRYRRQDVQYLSLAADGSRLAVAWDCGSNELYCLSVYDLVDSE